jgi:hypothetical protein
LTRTRFAGKSGDLAADKGLFRPAAELLLALAEAENETSSAANNALNAGLALCGLHGLRLLGTEGVLEHLLGVGERLRRIAAPQVKIERDRERLDFVEHRRHRLVVDFDRLRRLFGNMRVGGEHCRDRLAGMANLALSKDRLVVKGRAVIGLGDDGANIRGGDDAVHPGDRGGCAGVDAGLGG